MNNIPQQDMNYQDPFEKAIITVGDYTISEIQSIFFDDQALRVPPYTVYRFDSDYLRWYYVYLQDGTPFPFIGTTDFIGAVRKDDIGLQKWRESVGYEKAREIMHRQADYGTGLHRLIKQYHLQGGFPNYEGYIRDFLVQYQEQEGFTWDTSPWARWYTKDLLAYERFQQERVVETWAIEVVLVGWLTAYDARTGEVFHLPVAGTCDWLGILNWNGKEQVGVVDFKSKNHYKDTKSRSFFAGHALQLDIYRRLIPQPHNFPDVEPAVWLNWAPKSWRSQPTYDLKNQTHSDEAQMLPHYLSTFHAEREKHLPKDVVQFTGDLHPGSDLTSLYEVMDYQEFLTAHKPEDVQPFMRTGEEWERPAAEPPQQTPPPAQHEQPTKQQVAQSAPEITPSERPTDQIELEV